MPSSDYQPPVAQLLSYGKPKKINRTQWFDYVEAYGYIEEHIPDLIRLASEEDLNWQDEGECYAPIHAYRTLGQRRIATQNTGMDGTHPEDRRSCHGVRLV